MYAYTLFLFDSNYFHGKIKNERTKRLVQKIYCSDKLINHYGRSVYISR